MKYIFVLLLIICALIGKAQTNQDKTNFKRLVDSAQKYLCLFICCNHPEGGAMSEEEGYFLSKREVYRDSLMIYRKKLYPTYTDKQLEMTFIYTGECKCQ
jgi:hypothetical protein